MVDYPARNLSAPRQRPSVTSAAVDARAALLALSKEAEACTRCLLHASRTRVVPGEGDPCSDLMFVGEAPGYHEDQQGRPFVGQAGQLLEELLSSIGLTREQVFIANVLKCRPPNNRDPLPDEVTACQAFLQRQIEVIEPKVICTLGNHATKLLSGNPTGITRVHGRPQVFTVADQSMYLYPIFHPAAALYTRAMLATLQEDVRRLPELLARPRPAPAGRPEAALTPDVSPVPPSPARTHDGPAQPPVRPTPPPEAPVDERPVATRGLAVDQGEQLGLF